MSKFRGLAALVAFGLTTAAAAQGMALQATVMQQKIVQENGKSVARMVPASKVTPGDNVFYVLTYSNGGTKAAADVVLINPVPSNLEYVGAEGNALVSVDKGRSYGSLTRLTVPGADGKLRPAVNADVTHVRWNLAPVAPGAKGQVRFQARLR